MLVGGGGGREGGAECESLCMLVSSPLENLPGRSYGETQVIVKNNW